MRFAIMILTGASLAGCSPEAGQPEEGTAEKAAEASLLTSAPVASAAPQSGLDEWLVGVWSFDGTCASDDVVVYDADGTMRNYSQAGTWEASGNVVTETITEEFEMGEPGSITLDPPTKRVIEVKRIDEGHGTLRFDGEVFPVTRC